MGEEYLPGNWMSSKEAAEKELQLALRIKGKAAGDEEAGVSGLRKPHRPA